MNKLENLLREQGRSKTWLAKQLNCSLQAVVGWCKNRHQPNWLTQRYISAILQVPHTDIFFGKNVSQRITKEQIKKYVDSLEAEAVEEFVLKIKESPCS